MGQGSTYNMVKRLVELKPVLTDMGDQDVSLSDLQWKPVEEHGKASSSLYKWHKNSKRSHTSNVIKEWKRLEHSLSQTRGLLAKTMRDSIKQREVQLLNNTILLAGVCVDST